MTQQPQATQEKTRCRGWLPFAGCVAAVVVVWLVVLPGLAVRPSLKARIEFLETRQIDPSAIFYTELENIDRVLDRLEQFQRDHPKALWQLTPDVESSFAGGDAASLPFGIAAEPHGSPKTSSQPAPCE